MAENKKSFILYCDLIHTIEKMPNEKAGELFKHILLYVNDKNPETDDLITNLTFEPIKQQLKRDLKKFEEVKEFKSNGGRLGNLKRWNEDLYNKVINKKITLEEAETIAENRKVSHTDVKQSHTIAKIAVNDNDNDNDNVIINNIDKRKLKFASTLKPFVDLYGKELLNDFYKYWTEPNKSNTKFKQELEKTWSLERRLDTWAKNDNNFNKNKNGKSNITDTEQFKNLTKTIRSTGDRI